VPERGTGVRPAAGRPEDPIGGRGEHPDRAWIETVRSALDRWAATNSGAPTSSVLGSGAIAAAEAAFSEMHAGRPALLLPSASYALRVALQAGGVVPGDEVICGAIDWPSGYAAVRSLGATPVPVAADPRTLTLDPAAAVTARTPRTRALIACHLHGVCADVPAIRRLLPGVTVIEDVAQALGSRLDGLLAGTMGDMAVLSLGPGKPLDAGEGGVLLSDGHASHDRAVAIACHPLRQLLTGLPDPDPAALAIRPHPVTAVLALHQLTRWSPATARSRYAETARRLAGQPALRLLAGAGRHSMSQPQVPVLLHSADTSPPPGVRWSRSGAQVMPGLAAADRQHAHRLLGRVRLAALAGPKPAAGDFANHAEDVSDGTGKPACPLRGYL
jgi:dTDP-4-amino-4,6-dideoxygalactose transaminase